MLTVLCVLHHLPGPGAFKLMAPLCECQLSRVTEENVSKMHVKDVVSQPFNPFSTGFKETRVQRELTCPDHLVLSRKTLN